MKSPAEGLSLKINYISENLIKTIDFQTMFHEILKEYGRVPPIYFQEMQENEKDKYRSKENSSGIIAFNRVWWIQL